MDVVKRAGGYAAARDNLRGAPAHERDQPPAEFIREHELAVLLPRGGVGEPERATASRDDGQLLGPRRSGDQVTYRGAHDGVANLVRGHDDFLRG